MSMQAFGDIERLLNTISDPREIDALRDALLLRDNELLQALFAVKAEKYGLKPYEPKITSLGSGAALLFGKSFLPWGGLPYPKEHAELGRLLLQLQDEKKRSLALSMLNYQRASLDHYGKPIYSLFTQEGRKDLKGLEAANASFFSTTGFTSIEEEIFIENTLGMVSKKSQETTTLFVGSGCKSGMGAFLSQDAGVINFGPQLSPFGDCSAFGLAGRAQKISLREEAASFSLEYCCRLAAPSPRRYAHLEDSGYSGMWLESKISFDSYRATIRMHFEQAKEVSRNILFSFFGKGETCLIAGSHRLKPHSLDRYQGPAQILKFLGKKGEISIEVADGSAFFLEVVPLAGDESFWGADFLAVYTLIFPSFAFSMSR